MRLFFVVLRVSPVALVVMGGSFCIVLLLRTLGVFVPVELRLYDWSIDMRSEVAAPDPRVVLIQIDEEDIRRQQQWPLSDATLAQVLTVLSAAQPRVIGVDIFRDLPVPPGQAELQAVLTSQRNLIVVTHMGGQASNSIPPPPVYKNTDQYGFGNMLVDGDGIVRRGLLFLSDERGTTVPSFAWQLALRYLHGEGIKPLPDASNPRHVRLGATVIRPLTTDTGGYVGLDARGYQWLIDFHRRPGSFFSFSLTTLLSGAIEPQLLKDTIVLIGVNAVSVADSFRTPHSHWSGGRDMPGVELHAHIVSQLLRIALGEDSPVAVWGEWQEGGWILGWSVIGGLLGLWVRSVWRLRGMAAAVSLLSLGVLSIVYVAAVLLALFHGWWIPFAPPVMAGLMAAPLVALTAHAPPPKWLWRLEERASLARFITPRAAMIGKIYAQARRRTGWTDADLTQPGVRMQWAEALYDTFSAYHIALARAPLTYGPVQEIRQPAEVYETRCANCLDASLLYAAALERSALSPVVIHLYQINEAGEIIGAHALCGLWADTPPEDERGLFTEEEEIGRLLQAQGFVPIETVGFLVKKTEQLIPGKKQLTFQESTEIAWQQLRSPSTLIHFLLDLQRLRDVYDIQPIDKE